MDPNIVSGQPQPRPKGNKSLRSGNVAIKIPSGKDIVQWLFQSCCRHRISLTVLRGSGQLSDVILRGEQSPIVGPFNIESLSGYVTFNSLESFFPFQVTLGAPDGRLYPRIMVGGTTSTVVKVAAMMTVLQDLENAPSSSNSSPHIMNVQFSESYKSITPHHRLNVPIQLENRTSEERDMINSVNHKPIAAVRRERVMAAETTVVMNKTLLSSELNNYASPSFRNHQRDEDNDVIMMESKNDELDDDFWNSLSPIVDLSPFKGV